MPFPGGDVTASSNVAYYLESLRDFPVGEVDRNDHESVQMSDYLFTREWSSVRTVDQAEAFLAKLLPMTTENEREYIYDVYRGARASEYAVRVLEERAAEIEADIEVMLAERDPEVAEYVDALPSQMTMLADIYRAIDAENEALQSMMAMPPASPSMPAMVGGNGIEDVYDYRIYKLLALADAYHDFRKTTKKTKYRVDKKHIKASIEPEFPLDVDPESFAANEEPFIQYMESHPTIAFDDGTFGHNLHGRGLLDKFDVKEAMNRTHDYWLAYREQYLAHQGPEPVQHADVWSLPQFEDIQDKARPEHSEPKNHKAVVFLSQIVNVIATIKRLFRRDGREGWKAQGYQEDLTFIVDKTEDPMTRMVMATPHMDFAIRRFFVVKMGKRDLGDSEARSESRASDDEIIQPRYTWKYSVCDANLVDGPKHIWPRDQQDYRPNPSLSKLMTGPVFREEDKVQIEYHGIHGNDFDPSVDVTVDGVRDTYSHELDEFSAPFMKKQIQTIVQAAQRSEGPDVAVDVSLQLSSKRACDWGAVEHCRRYGCVFVSSDRLACLYAMYRNVDFILLRQEETGNKSLWARTPVIFQNTFTMVRALTPDEEAEKVRVTDGGARKAGAFLQAVLAALVIACAFM